MSISTPSPSPLALPRIPGIAEINATPLIANQLEDFVRGQNSIIFESVDDAAFAYICALCAHALPDGDRLWVTHPNPRIRDRICAELYLWGTHPLLFPDLAENPGEEAVTAPEIVAERQAVMQLLNKPSTSKKPQVIVMSALALKNACPKPNSLKSAARKISVGDTLDPAELEKDLLSHGYEKVPQVYMQGQFAMRGGILDVYSWHGTIPLRIEFFDTEIESLREFNIHSQVSNNRASAYEITLAELQMDGEFLDYLEANDRLLAVQNNDDEIPVDAHGIILSHGNAIKEPLCVGSPLGVFDAGDFILNEARRHRFFQQLADWDLDGWRVFLTFSNKGEKERFLELVDPNFFSPNKVEALCGELAQGFTIPRAKLAFISSAEIFGRYQTQPTRRRTHTVDHQRRARAQTALEDIKDGDLLVHAEYGIGRFEGIKHNDEGLEEIHIGYRDGSVLSVPLDHSHLLSKYVGLGGKEPDLTRLGTASWGKARSSAEKSILDYAAKLLQMQAERHTSSGHSHPPDTKWMWEFENSFHHTLTEGQAAAIEDVKTDMESSKPMDRLVCGDVGFGKTEVAIRATFKAVTGGKQAVILVPTTVLAEQHWRTFRERMSDYPIRIDLLNRFRSAKEIRETLEGISSGAVDIVIGTHRLLSADVAFKKLGVAIVDEEQRFGVKHKERFKEMFSSIDVLTLSATPIPRTLYLSLMGARDMSTIDTPIPGKVSINTSIHGYDERVIRESITRELNRGGQVFFLHNRVKSIELVRKKLRSLMPDASIVVGHGQMEKDELEVVMRNFVQGKADILLATTIIESGIDIPNANTIIIDRADRFGLADLYQLRGRVGRSNAQAYAILMLPRDLIQGDARKRINAIRQYTALGSGFKIAMRDLEIRGAGNLLGTKQSGHIAAVGFDLYCQLLRQSIDRLSDGKSRQRLDVTLRTDFLYFNEAAQFLDGTADDSQGLTGQANMLPAYLPASYIPEARMRISAYKELAELISMKELISLRNRWIDRFGKPPTPVHHLLSATEIKLAAAQKGISSVDIRKQKLMLTRNGEFIFIAHKRFPRLTEHLPENKITEVIDLINSF